MLKACGNGAMWFTLSVNNMLKQLASSQRVGMAGQVCASLLVL